MRRTNHGPVLLAGLLLLAVGGATLVAVLPSGQARRAAGPDLVERRAPPTDLPPPDIDGRGTAPPATERGTGGQADSGPDPAATAGDVVDAPATTAPDGSGPGGGENGGEGTGVRIVRTKTVPPPHPPPIPDPAAAVEKAAELRALAAETVEVHEQGRLLAEAERLERTLAPLVGPVVRGDVRDADLVWAVLAANAALADRFEPTEEPVEITLPWEAGGSPPAAVVVRLGKGVHRFDPDTLKLGEELPVLVIVEGAGMDETALIGPSHWHPRTPPLWTFRDCTIDCDNDEFVHGGGPAELRLERVRVVGCDTGAGGAEMFDGRGLIVAVDCMFESGFGKSPGSVNLFVGNDLSVRLDGCVFVGPFERFSHRNRVLATDCTFRWAPVKFADELVASRDRETNPKLGAGSRFVNCTVESTHDRKLRWPRRKLEDINPAWTDRR